MKLFLSKCILEICKGVNINLLPLCVSNIYENIYYRTFRVFSGFCFIIYSTLFIYIMDYEYIGCFIFIIAYYHFIQTFIVSCIKVYIGVIIINSENNINNIKLIYIVLYIRIVLISLIELLGFLGFIDQIVDLFNSIYDMRKNIKKKVY